MLTGSTYLDHFAVSRAIATASVLLNAAMGAALTILAPLLVGAYSDIGTFSPHHVGWLVSADFAGILFAAACAYFCVHKIHWQLTSIISLVAWIAINLFSGFVAQFETLLVVRFIAGMACGINYAIALSAISKLPKSHQAFSLVVTIQIIFGSLGFFILPHYIESLGFQSIFLFVNAFLLITLICTLLAYPVNNLDAKRQSFKIDGSISIAIMAFLSIFVYYLAQGIIWSHLERIGIAMSISATEVSELLGLGFALSACGSMLSVFFSEKWGHKPSLIATFVIQSLCLFSLYMVNSHFAIWVFALSTIAYQIMWSFVVPVLMDIFNKADGSGKLIVLCIAAFKLGFMLGPPLASWVMMQSSQSYLLVTGAALLLISTVLAFVAQSKLSTT